MTKPINRILIANRGEIAIRIIRTCQSMGITTIAIHSKEDEQALFTQMADFAVELKGESLSETYLNISKIIEIAKRHNVDAIHPGYGFLSENEQFAKACETAEVLFIGPSAKSIQLMGDKVASRKFAKQHGIPLLEGIEGSYDELLAKKGTLKYPVIIKASAGGGGKGMRVVEQESDLQSALEATAREAKTYFGNDEVFIERYIQNPRHIEVQILGDYHGNLVHLYERECTIQRRHQKIIEEAPSITLNNEQREAITSAAVELARAANYYSAGTVEFIVDEQLNFYFMEMNTRIQVEHPVSENITGIDLIEQQINIASGLSLPFQQEDLTIDGHSIECRIYAEDPENDFRPSPGEITYYSAPSQLPLTRLDAALDKAQEISGSYDPMIAKLITWGNTRNAAIETMQTALDEYIIQGIPTNINYLKAILKDKRFIENRITTNYCKQFTKDLINKQKQKQQAICQEIPLLACAIFSLQQQEQQTIWQKLGPYRLLSQLQFTSEDKLVNLGFEQKEKCYLFKNIGETYRLENVEVIDQTVWFFYNHKEYAVNVHQISPNSFLANYNGFHFTWQRADFLDTTKNYLKDGVEHHNTNGISSPIPGTVVKIITVNGAKVKQGDALIIVEAMKMENTLTAPRDGVIQSIKVQPNDKVGAGELLIEFEQENTK